MAGIAILCDAFWHQARMTNKGDGVAGVPKNIVLSVKFDVRGVVSQHAENAKAILGKRCYNPNAFNKEDCMRPCLGTELSDGSHPPCGMWKADPDGGACWRCSYRWHLGRTVNGEKAVMLRLLENGEMGKGQEIEAKMAEQLGTTVYEIPVVAKVGEGREPIGGIVGISLHEKMEMREKLWEKGLINAETDHSPGCQIL
mmetsp:Transcript_102249/g.288873  ORF Transcript_102249/g.288873 Transcript_102249/m.288873 type:complete len:199 (+) Transcript_102249:113-709(+)|eukprot:CAMPEP_0117552466 /NCGR_PEP_ID=MMETSP0784-20121206/49721_1 /TAXON_ID=39447 /ORGANISM="" /LENGTH=198 /DNA_ID=CAMNT_0005349537 /DNA_START=109 /DNA_END=705 /DNA_ORIENTATION=+